MDPHGAPDQGRRARPLRLRDAFPPVPAAAWDAVVREDLPDADAEGRLLWQADEVLAVKPFFRREDLAGLEGQLEAAPGEFPFHRGKAGAWTPASLADLPVDGVRADLLHDAGATAVQEIGYAIAEGVDRLAAATSAGRGVDEAARAIVFVVAIGGTYFLEIAKLRALRLAWAQAVSAFGPGDAASARATLFARTARLNKSRCDPYMNLLRATTEAMAAAMGGADRLAVEAFGFDAHLAENVHHILADEAHLDAVADPAGGSYLVERLTDALAREAWQLFQGVEAAGGHAAAVASGSIDAAVGRARADRQQAVAERRRTLVGVNDYPDLAAAGETLADAPSRLTSPPGGARLAEPFEAVRLRTARHLRETGRVPRVALLTRGDPIRRTARANFARNLFGCAGFAVAETDRPEETAGADLIVLCSSDDEYPALAREVCPHAGAPVVVAGRPDSRGALTAAGVEGFVHAGIDAVATLESWQDRLGIAR